MMQETKDPSSRIVAVGLLTERDLSLLGSGFRRAYRLDEDHDFGELLARIDAADGHGSADRSRED